jgi:hypothetical protein
LWLRRLLDRDFSESNGMESATMARRFPAPWREEKFSGGYVVRDATGLCPEWVRLDRIGRGDAAIHVRYASHSDHSALHDEPSRCANSGHYQFQLPGERLAMMLTTLNVITTSPA